LREHTVPIQSGEVHVHLASLWALSAGPEDSALTCSEDEFLRSARFGYVRDRDRFLAARTFLRETLARHLDMPAREIRFRLGPHGKPGVGGDDAFEFSCSRSGIYAAVAVARAPVGIDLEEIRPGVWTGEIASALFTPAARAWLGSVPESGRTVAFYRLWVALEAYLKARGEGLVAPFGDFDAALRAYLDRRAGSARTVAGSFALHEIVAIPGYAMAVASAAEPAACRLFWP
jgi:4'-phosphopantetheinyl transferase